MSDSLKEQIKSLKEALKENENLVEKYREALRSSNERIEKVAKNLEEGVSLIRGIHRNLLPTDLPDIPYFEFSYKFLPTSIGVSGDFFDVVKIKDTLKFGIIISNCNTYAITSLFLSSFLRSSHNLNEFKTSKDFLSYVLKKISSSISEKDELNIFYGIVDRRDFTLDYCMLGDVFAGIKSQGHSDYQEFSPTVKNLKESINNQVIDLNPRDQLLLCSPGVSLAKNSKNEKFGSKNILKAALEGAKDGVLGVRQNILFNCDQFIQEEIPSKDRTILVMEVKDRVLKLSKPEIT